MNNQELNKMSRKELIQAYIVRNDDAKDYAKEITRLQKKLKEHKKWLDKK